MFDLTGKKALVTGSTQGIGFEIASCLAKMGAHVFIHGATGIEKCKNACKSIPNSSPVQANLLNRDDLDRLYSETGDVDILVLNASMQLKKKWDEYTDEEYDMHMDCNVKSSYILMKKYAPAMKEKKWGRIVTVGSVNQYNNHPQLSIYGASKVAQMKLVESAAKDLAPYGITVNNIAPGAIDTPRNSEALSDTEFKKKVESSIPCGYVGTPEDISPAVLLLCSDEGRYITGSDLKIDGGMSL